MTTMSGGGGGGVEVLSHIVSLLATYYKGFMVKTLSDQFVSKVANFNYTIKVFVIFPLYFVSSHQIDFF